jgi:muconate cycloisomerase
MRIVAATIFALRLPFAESFRHSAQERSFSDSFIVRVRAEDGTVGYGEGVARPYVTGETVETSIAHIAESLWPAVTTTDYPELIPGPDPLETLAPIERSLPDFVTRGVLAWHAARTAVELALVDCLLRRRRLSLARVLAPVRQLVIYSGVITAGTIQKAVQHARYFKLFRLQQVKLKLCGTNDCERVAAVRRTVGPEVSLRVDANGAYDVPRAIAILNCLKQFDIAVAEQPLRRGDPQELAQVREASPIPVMADESLVTLADAQALIEARACDYFNLRLSKCGGLSRTLRMARMAAGAGVRLQLGCQVGETAILSAAGRGLAAHLPEIDFVEGSYGNLLLAEDIGKDSINFGHGGRAPLLKGAGLGLGVREEILGKYAHSITALGGN